MDRHYVKGATRSSIEIAHQNDLDIQDEYGVTFMTYWFDEARSTAFCLVDAPDKEAIRQLHERSHGMIPNEIVEVDPNIVQAFLGRIEDPAPVPGTEGGPDQHEIEPAFRSIMFTKFPGSEVFRQTDTSPV
ncbi:MAG: DUF4242 domain-containing protein [Chloroflexota bacterium]|nr:MAG: DUF4242 domain-containing protein [Chloroflexota bacterium]